MSDNTNIEKSDDQECIKSLELSLSILQKENESLRQVNENKLSIDKNDEISYSDYRIIANSKDLTEFQNNIDKILKNKFSFLEYSIFKYSSKNGLTPLFFEDEYLQFYNYCENYIENGVIDWLFDNDQIRLIPDLDNKIESEPLKVLLIPHKTDIENLVFISKLSDEISNSPLVKLREILALISLKYNELTFEGKENNSKSFENENTIIHSIAEKLELDIEKMEVNLNLLKMGIGSMPKRIDILNSDLSDLKELAIIIQDYLDKKHDLDHLIQNIIFFTQPKLNKLAISISSELSSNVEITVNFDSLLHNLIKLIFTLSRNLPEGSYFNIISNIDDNHLFLKIKDNGYGFPLKLIDLINQDQNQIMEIEDNFSELIEIKRELKNKNISFEMVSKERAGTTINLQIPI